MIPNCDESVEWPYPPENSKWRALARREGSFHWSKTQSGTHLLPDRVFVTIAYSLLDEASLVSLPHLASNLAPTVSSWSRDRLAALDGRPVPAKDLRMAAMRYFEDSGFYPTSAGALYAICTIEFSRIRVRATPPIIGIQAISSLGRLASADPTLGVERAVEISGHWTRDPLRRPATELLIHQLAHDWLTRAGEPTYPTQEPRSWWVPYDGAE